MSPYYTSAGDQPSYLTAKLARLPVRVIRSSQATHQDYRSISNLEKKSRAINKEVTTPKTINQQRTRSKPNYNQKTSFNNFQHQMTTSISFTNQMMGLSVTNQDAVLVNQLQTRSSFGHHQVTKLRPQLQPHLPLVQAHQPYDHLQPRPMLNKMHLQGDIDRIQEQVLEYHSNLRRSRGQRWTVDWSKMKYWTVGVKNCSLGKKYLEHDGRQSRHYPYQGQALDTPSVYSHNVAPPWQVSSPLSVDNVSVTPALPCQLPSPFSVDSGYETAESSPSSTIPSLQFVMEIDQFLDSFEIEPSKDILDNTEIVSLELDNYEPVSVKDVLDQEDKAGQEIEFYEESFPKSAVKIKPREVIESIENIEEYVKKITGLAVSVKDPGHDEKCSVVGQDITMYDINGRSFTVLQVDPIYACQEN